MTKSLYHPTPDAPRPLSLSLIPLSTAPLQKKRVRTNQSASTPTHGLNNSLSSIIYGPPLLPCPALPPSSPHPTRGDEEEMKKEKKKRERSGIEEKKEERPRPFAKRRFHPIAELGQAQRYTEKPNPSQRVRIFPQSRSRSVGCVCRGYNITLTCPGPVLHFALHAAVNQLKPLGRSSVVGFFLILCLTSSFLLVLYLPSSL